MSLRSKMKGRVVRTCRIYASLARSRTIRYAATSLTEYGPRDALCMVLQGGLCAFAARSLVGSTCSLQLSTGPRLFASPTSA